MRRIISTVLLVALGSSGVAHAIAFGDTPLRASAQAEACHLLFIRLYRATLYTDASGGTRCLELEYRRGFSAEELGRATLTLYEDYFGADRASADADRLQAVADAYRAVAPGDRYGFCFSRDHGSALLREGEQVLPISDSAFASRLLGLWIERFEQDGRPHWRFRTCG